MNPQAKALLLACVPAQRDEQHLKRLVQDGRFDLTRAFRLASMHGMVGIVAPVLRALLDGDLKDSPEAPWLRCWNRLSVHDLTQLAALKEILRCIQTAGLRPLLLKGLAIHLQAYPSHETARGAGDMDLMVCPAEVLPIKRCLEELGFVFRGTDSWSRPVSDWKKFIERDSEALFCRPHPPVAVDLHWRLCAPKLERACGITLSERIWHRTRTIQTGGIMMTVPGREEEVLMLCLHMFKGGTFLLRSLADLAHILRGDPPLDWGLLFQIGEETGTLECAYHALHLVARLDPQAVPEAAQRSLRSWGGPARILAPSLRLDRLLVTRGEHLADLGTFWNGVLFARHPWRWFPYTAGRIGGWLVRQALAAVRAKGVCLCDQGTH